MPIKSKQTPVSEYRNTVKNQTRRIPEKYGELIRSQLHGPIENIYIDTEGLKTYLQSARPDVPVERSLEIVARELGVGDQLEDALVTGSLKVNYATWLEKTVKTPLYDGIKDHIKFGEDGLTYAQAAIEEQRIQTAVAEEQTRAEELIARNEELRAGYDQVYQDVKTRLQIAGRPANIRPRDWNAWVDKNARLWAAHAAAEAAKRGITVNCGSQGRGQLQTGRYLQYPGDNCGPKSAAGVSRQKWTDH